MTYHVYGLIDPRQRNIFYIGHTKDSYKRLKAHAAASDPIIPSYQTCLVLRDCGIEPQICIFESFEDKDSALRLEVEIVKSFPDHLVNSQRKHSRRLASDMTVTSSPGSNAHMKYYMRKYRAKKKLVSYPTKIKP